MKVPTTSNQAFPLQGQLPLESDSLAAARVTLHKLNSGPEQLVDQSHYWRKVRRPPSRDDLHMSAAAEAWLQRLPAPLRPRETARLFPHVVNRLCRAWRHDADRAAVFDELLRPTQRRQRRGFPVTVARELRALQLAVEEAQQRRRAERATFR